MQNEKDAQPKKSLPHPPPSRRWDSFGISHLANVAPIPEMRRTPTPKNAHDITGSRISPQVI